MERPKKTRNYRTAASLGAVNIRPLAQIIHSDLAVQNLQTKQKHVKPTHSEK
jgi:hypothetical protein